MEATLKEYLQSQDDLLREAAEALPHQFSQCTYPLGHLRQAVYLCLTCPEDRGICSACSIACHTNHEQVELFPKRNFRCDCPTMAITHKCTLRTKCEEENTSNTYGQNFRNMFCRCGRPYDAKTERETMIQCLVCEVRCQPSQDWFHESCCNLRERPNSRQPSPVTTREDDDAASEASSSGLPPPLISGADYESFICAACVFDNEVLRKWTGTPGAIIVTRESLSSPWRLEQGNIRDENAPLDIVESPDTLMTGSKRPLSPSDHSPESKRVRTSYDTPESTPRTCLAPPSNPVISRIFAGGLKAALDPSTSLGTGDIFFKEGFRDRWCRCTACLPSLQVYPYLLEEEDTYEPPEDPDSGEFAFLLHWRSYSQETLLFEGLSLEELGMRALERIPRDRAIDGIHAFQEMRDDLMNFLRPFAQEGKVVNESDVRGFFASLAENSKKARG
ncbi:Protein mlo2 [Leucoagaricus sp. SymC.cos]|nr:Protein mlo2 [Leucoagaricus sp. SymC.cos]